MTQSNKLLAEAFGTFWLVLGGCGAAVLAAGVPGVGIGYLGVSLAFGLTVLTMAYAVGHISGGHFNPAVTLGLWAGGRFPAREILWYWLAQITGAIGAAFLLYLIASGKGLAGVGVSRIKIFNPKIDAANGQIVHGAGRSGGDAPGNHLRKSLQQHVDTSLRSFNVASCDSGWRFRIDDGS